MKKVILSVAVAVLGFVATSCSKSYDCDCYNYGSASYTTSTVKASNASEGEYTCEAKGTAAGITPKTDCHLR